MIILKKLIPIIFFILLYQCGYSAVYKDKDTNFKIVVLELNGNKDINNKIKFNLKKHLINDSNKEFRISINSTLNKNVISKDLTGKATNYDLTAISTFNIYYKGITKVLSFNENLKIKNIDNSFEQKKHEDEIINNFASSIYNKLIVQLELIE